MNIRIPLFCNGLEQSIIPHKTYFASPFMNFSANGFIDYLYIEKKTLFQIQFTSTHLF